MTPRAVIIHSLEHARAALAAAERLDRPIVLYSAEGAAAYGGAAWFQSIVAAAQEACPRARYEAVLDCGTNAALAVAALRQGCRAVAVRGAPALRRKLAAIAAASDARLDPGAHDVLDLRHSKHPEADVATWLQRVSDTGR